MPITADDLLAATAPTREAQRAAQTPRSGRPAISTTTTPVSDPDALAKAFSEELGEMAGPAKGFVRGMSERIAEPALRLTGALPRGGKLQTAGDVLQLGAALHPATALISTGGAAAVGVAEAAGLSPNVSRWLGIAAEVGLGGFGLLRAGKAAASKGEKIAATGKALKEVEPIPGVAQLKPTEKVGEWIKTLSRTTLLSRKNTLSRGLEALDKEIVKTVPSIAPGTPGYTRMGNVLATIVDRAVRLPPDVENSFINIFHKLKSQKPLSTADVMYLRKRLNQLGRSVDAADPDVRVTAKNARAVHRELTDALEAALPDELGGRYAEARMAYRTQYAEPWRNVKNVVNRNVTPQQAFMRVFNPNDMHTFRAVSEIISSSPAAKGKLQMGFMEWAANASDGFQNAEKAHDAFKQLRPALASSGLFSAEELSNLDLFLKRRELPTLIEKMRVVLDEPLTLKKGGVGTALGFFALHNPMLAVTAMIGSGALPQLRRIAVLPAGSIAAKKLAVIALNKTERFAQSLRQTEYDGELDEQSED